MKRFNPLHGSRSLTRDFSIGFLIIILLISILVFSISGLIFLKIEGDKFKTDASSTFQNFKNLITAPLWHYDDEEIAAICMTFLSGGIVSKIVIYSEDDRQLYSFGNTKENDSKVGFFSEDLFYNTKLIGKVEFYSKNPKYFEHTKFYFYTTISAIFVISIFITMATWWLLRIYVNRPLDKLLSWINQVEKGEYDNAKIDYPQREIQSVVNHFSLMVDSIKNREQQIRESEERFKTLFEYSPDAYYLNDFEGNFIDGNRKAEDLLGYKREELIGKNFLELDLLPVEELQKATELLAENMGGKSTGPDEFTLKKKDGRQVAVEISTIPIDIGGRDLILGAARDITERKQAAEALRESEEKLTRSKKMESLGLLAGGVAHDLNNVLSGIVSYPELILMDLPKDSKFRKPIETIQETGHKAADIVQDLLTIARGVAITREPLNLNDLVGEYLHSPEFNKLKQLHPKVTVKTNLDMDLFNINGSNVHIRKAVLNLVSNAAEAVVGSGKVTISTINRYMDRPLRGYDDVNIGEYVILSVSDDGSGIPLDDLERIFEPFYTKKVMGKSGTGLGLAVVWNIMLDHKGYIDVITGENGSTFELYFPMTREELSGKDLSIPLSDYKGNGETILVVDDVESQRDISCKMLDILDYQTKAVSSGEEAVEYLKENTVDLILLDMIMDPGINGRETYEQIIKINPNQKAIIVSGFAVTDDVKVAQKLGAGKYIKKPYTIEQIGLAVKEELGK